MGAAVLAAACATGGSGAASQAVLPSDIPMPAQATLVMGAQGGGTDANAMVYGFTTNLPPAQARLAYVAELRAAGYLPTGEAAGWFLFRNSAGVVLAISFGSSGPPTGIVVRVLPPGSTPTPAPPAEPSGSLGSAEVPRPDPPHGPPAWASSEGAGNGNAGGKGLGDGNGVGNGSGHGNSHGNGNAPGNGVGNGNAPGRGNGAGNGKAHGKANGQSPVTGTPVPSGAGAGTSGIPGNSGNSGNAHGAAANGNNPGSGNGGGTGSGNSVGNGKATGKSDGHAHVTGIPIPDGAGAGTSGVPGSNGNVGNGNGAGKPDAAGTQHANAVVNLTINSTTSASASGKAGVYSNGGSPAIAGSDANNDGNRGARGNPINTVDTGGNKNAGGVGNGNANGKANGGSSSNAAGNGSGASR